MCMYVQLGQSIDKKMQKARNSTATSNEPGAKTGYGEQKQGTVHVHALHTTTGVDKTPKPPTGLIPGHSPPISP